MSVQTFITVFNRVTTTKTLVNQLLKLPGIGDITILDNNSSYPPLLRWYEEECPVSVLRFDRNYLNMALWESGTVQNIKSEYYIVIDCDVSIERCPSDLVLVLQEGFKRFPDRIRVGPNIALDDLPENYKKRFQPAIRRQLRLYWSNLLDNDYIAANVDTYFCMCKRSITYHNPPLQRWSVKNSLRTNYPYVIRHMPWYVDYDNASDEEFYYWQHWAYPQPRKRPFLQMMIEARKKREEKT